MAGGCAAPSGPDVVVIPTDLVWHGDTPIVVFGEVETKDLDLPFWFQTTDRARRIVGMDPLDSLTQPTTALHVAGTIFHTSRCGSTLVTRQCGVLPDVLALSEPPLFEYLLDRHDGDRTVRARRLRLLVALHRDALASVASRLVIKWSALVGLYAVEIEAALPEIPAVFLHRDPRAVMCSIEAERPGALDNLRPRHLGEPELDGDFAAAMEPLEVSARLIARICRSVAVTSRIRSLAYDDLPDATPDRVAPFFGLRVSPADRRRMLAAAAVDAKDPERRRAFRPRPRRDLLGDDPVRRLADEVVTPALREATSLLAPL